MALELNEPYYSSSESCIGQRFAHFQPQKTDYSQDRSWWETVSPTVPISDTSRHIQFNVDPCPFFIIPDQCYFLFSLKLTKSDGTNNPGPSAGQTPYASATFCQSIGTSIIKNLSVLINGTNVSDSNTPYYYAAYFANLLTYEQDCRSSKLEKIGKLGAHTDTLIHRHTERERERERDLID